MDTLTDEISQVCAYLSDKDNIHLSSVSKRLSVIKFRVLFFTKMLIKDIIHLSYFHQFSNVIVSNTNELVPKHVIHLIFGWDFDKPINSCISDSVTHLTFGDYFNQPINSCIPNSVTHLTFGCYFNQNIDELSISINNISLSGNYKRKISENMLSKVTVRSGNI